MTAAERKQVNDLLQEWKRLHYQEAEARKKGAAAEVLKVFAAAKAERLALIRKRLGLQ